MSVHLPVLPASCDHCRLRKVKCDRQQPCTNCSRRKTKCVLSTTTARPRGREGGRKSKKTTELQDRVAKLEALVHAVSASVEAAPGTSFPSIAEEDPKSDDTRISKDNKLYQYAAGHIWSQLSSQIEGLRDVLIDSSDDESNSTPDSQPSIASQKYSDPGYYQSILLCNSSGLVVSDLNSIEHPSPVIREKLLTIYEQNVDPLCKVFHKPTLRSHIATISTNALVSPEEAEVHAALFAIYGAAILSMPDGESDLLLNCPRDVALRSFCFAIEFYLVKANFLDSRRLGPLQALVVYLLIIRFLEPGQKHWVLFGLTVQLARELGLHSAKNIQNFPPLQHELRCRVWHTLRLLDFRAALDRGAECVIGPDSFDTQLPQNLNDEDLYEGQAISPDSRETITDVSVGLIGYNSVTALTELYHIKPTHLDPSNPSNVWLHRQKIACDYEQRVKEGFAKFCDKSIPLHWMLNYAIDISVTLCHLLAIRPMSYVKDTSLPLPLVDSKHILERSISSLQEDERFFANETARGFQWFVWVHWYVLAVALVELGASPSALLDEFTWNMVLTTYDRQSRLIADTSNGSLWKPLRKLMNKVQLLRQSIMCSRADANEPLAPVPGFSGLHIDSDQNTSWTFDISQGQDDGQLPQSGALYGDSSMLDMGDPFVQWDAFLGVMTDVDPFPFWTATEDPP